MTTSKQLAEGVRRVRQHRRVTQARLADEMTSRGFRWTQQTVAKSELGNRPLRVDEVVALADLFGLSVDVLLGREPMPQVCPECRGRPHADVAVAALQAAHHRLETALDSLGVAW